MNCIHKTVTSSVSLSINVCVYRGCIAQCVDLSLAVCMHVLSLQELTGVVNVCVFGVDVCVVQMCVCCSPSVKDPCRGTVRGALLKPGSTEFQ